MNATSFPKAAGAAAPTVMDAKRPTDDILNHLREYAREKPEVVALWCFGIGFILGWKLKPW